MFAHFGMDKGGHIGVKGIHQLFGPLDDGDLHTQLPQILRHFQSDEAAAHHDSGFRLVLIDKFLDPESILHGAQGEEFAAVHTGQIGPYRLGTGSKQQFIIVFLKDFPGVQVFHGNGLPVGMDGGDLMADLHMDPEPPEKAFRCLQRQILRIFDHTADVIGQTAVGIGNISGTFKHNDLGFFVQSSDSGSSGGAACHTAYDDNFHKTSTFP